MRAVWGHSALCPIEQPWRCSARVATLWGRHALQYPLCCPHVQLKQDACCFRRLHVGRAR